MNTGTEPLYTAEQIRIPPDLPDILKNYTKHIIRTQPGNIMKESFEYFGRLARQKTDTSNLKRLNNMQLEAIYNKFDSPAKAVVSRTELDEACNAFSIPAAQINDIIRLGGWTGDRIPWTKCWALLVASAAGNLTATIETVANILSDNARVRVGPVVEILQYLAEQDRTVDKSQVDQLIRGLMANANDAPVADVINLVRQEIRPSSASLMPSAPPVAAAPPSQTAAPTQAPAAPPSSGAPALTEPMDIVPAEVPSHAGSVEQPGPAGDGTETANAQAQSEDHNNMDASEGKDAAVEE